MEFKKGDKVIINGDYYGIIIRATPERDMYVVRYRHPSENTLVNIMYRGGELDLMSPPRPNPYHSFQSGEEEEEARDFSPDADVDQGQGQNCSSGLEPEQQLRISGLGFGPF